MKKIALVSVAALALAVPALANASDMKATGAASSMTAEKKIELKNGDWAEVGADGSVKVSKDGGKTWTPAPDGTWEAKDGSKLTTKGGKKM